MNKIKRISAIILALCMLLVIAPTAYPEEVPTSGSCGENTTWSYAGNCLYINGTGDMASYSYSSSVPWYYYRDNIQRIQISSGVTSIGDYAFSCCSKAVSANISGSSVKKIGSSAFSDCSKLMVVSLPRSLQEIESYAFGWCSALSSITLPNSLRKIGAFAFSGCSAISSLSLPSQLETIEDNAFFNCKGLESFTIPRGVTTLGDSVFRGCSSLTEVKVESGNLYYSTDDDSNLYNADKTVFIYRLPTKTDSVFTLPDTVETIAASAFSGCTYLSSVIYSDENVKKIEYGAFKNSGLTEAKIYAGIEYGDDVFSSCKALESVYIEDGVKRLENAIFADCTSLTDATIPDSVMYMGALVFRGCTSLENVKLSKNLNYVMDWVFKGCTALAEITIPDTVTSIGMQAFENCTDLQSVTIGSGVNNISNDAFSGCTALQNIYVSSDNKAFFSEDSKALYNKEKTKLILYPAGRTEESYVVLPTTRTIGYNAFEGCAALTNVELNDGLESIFSEAFLNCSSLGKVEIPESVTYIPASAFRNTAFYENTENWTDNCLYNGNWLIEVKADAKNYTTLSIAQGTKYLAEGCIYRSSWTPIGITIIDIPESLESMSDGAFSECKKLTEFVVSEDNRFYLADDEGVLYNKEKTEILMYPKNKTNSEYVVPDTVENVGVKAFSDCEKLTRVTLPSAVKNIKNDAFASCRKLEFLNLPEGLESIGDAAFYYCDRFYPTALPETVEYVGANAFRYSAAFEDSANWSDDLFYIGDYLVDSNLNSAITELTIKEGTRAIAPKALRYNFLKLISITLPASLKLIESGSLSDCDSLQNIFVAEGNSSFSATDGVLYNKDMTMLLQYPRAKQGLSFEIPETVETIGGNSFYACRTFESLTIPASVRMISDGAFNYCYKLRNISYSGTPAEWKEITIMSGNECLENAAVTYCAPYTESAVNRTDGAVIVKTTAHNIENGKKIIAAGYIGKKLLDLQMSVSDGREQRFSLSGNADNVAIYVWNENLSPYVKTAEKIDKSNFTELSEN